MSVSPIMSEAEKFAVMVSHAKAAADMSIALVAQLEEVRVDAAMDSLICIRHRHDLVAGLIGTLVPSCSPPTAPA
jgi:hypothetical protein